MLVFTGTRGTTSATTESECSLEDTGRAGLARLWAIPCAAVSDITFGVDREVTAVALRCGTMSEWQEVGFTPGTGQVQQSQSGFNRYSQLITVSIEGQSNYNRNQINILSACSCWHFVGLTEGGSYHYFGIHTYERGNLTLWESAELQAGGNTANTGVTVTEGGNGYLLSFSASAVHQLAPFAMNPEDISTDCNNQNTDCGEGGLTDLADNCLTNFNGDNLTSL